MGLECMSVNFCKLLRLNRFVPKFVTVHDLFPDLYKTSNTYYDQIKLYRRLHSGIAVKQSETSTVDQKLTPSSQIHLFFRTPKVALPILIAYNPEDGAKYNKQIGIFFMIGTKLIVDQEQT